MFDHSTHLSAVPASAPVRNQAFSILSPVGIAIAGTAFIAIAAHVAVPLPFTPVPLTLQPFAVLLVGLLFGPTLGLTTLLLYLAEGAMGLPVFQPQGPGGLLQLTAFATSGFLLSYPWVAAIAGTLYRKLPFRSRYASAALAGTVATAFLFLAGATWFAVYTHLGLRAVLIGAVLPFLPGEAIKVLAAAGIAAAWTNRATR